MKHPQVETKYGFSCDEGVVKMCEAIWESGIAQTACSCQGEGTSAGYLEIISKNNVQLSKLSLRLFELLPPEGGWSLSLTYIPPKPIEKKEDLNAQLSLHFLPNFIGKVEEAVVKAADYMWKCHCGWKAPADYFGNLGPSGDPPLCPNCGCYLSYPWQKGVYGKDEFCELEERKRTALVENEVKPFLKTLKYSNVAAYAVVKIERQFNVSREEAVRLWKTATNNDDLPMGVIHAPTGVPKR